MKAPKTGPEKGSLPGVLAVKRASCQQFRSQHLRCRSVPAAQQLPATAVYVLYSPAFLVSLQVDGVPTAFPA